MTLKSILALGLLSIAARLTGRSLDIGEDGELSVNGGPEQDTDAFDEDEPDPATIFIAGPVAVTYDWDGDIVSVSVMAKQTPENELAGWLMGSHWLRTTQGFREAYRA